MQECLHGLYVTAALIIIDKASGSTSMCSDYGCLGLQCRSNTTTWAIGTIQTHPAIRCEQLRHGVMEITSASEGGYQASLGKRVAERGQPLIEASS
jgi:hypothetical protein